MISIIVAMGKNRVIGNKGKLPWHLPNDLAYFKELTIGHTVVMGKNTYESLPDKYRPLPDRYNIVLSRSHIGRGGYKNVEFGHPECYDIESWREHIEGDGSEEMFVIGGGKIYEYFMPYVSRLYVTYIDHEFEGDAFFPEYGTDEWRLADGKQGIKDEKNPYDYYFRIYERKTK